MARDPPSETPGALAQMVKAAADDLTTIAFDLNRIAAGYLIDLKPQTQQLFSLGNDLSEVPGELRKVEKEHKRTANDLRQENNRLVEENHELRRRAIVPPSRSNTGTPGPRVHWTPDTATTSPSQAPNGNTNGAPDDGGTVSAADNDLIKLALDDGQRAMSEGQYAQGAADFSRAKQIVEKLSPALQKKYRVADINYHLAICTSLDPTHSIPKKEQVLCGFVDSHATDKSLEPPKMAHIQHLLAQVYVCLGPSRIDDAEIQCRDAYEQACHFGENDERYQESVCLLGKICKAQGKVDDARLFLTSVPTTRKRPRTWLLPSQETPEPPKEPKEPKQPKRPKQPSTEAPLEPTTLPERPKRAPRETRISIPTRKAWLEELGIEHLVKNTEYKDALIRGDLEAVRSLIDRKVPSNFTLHWAALFGDVEIAQLLIDTGTRKVGEKCTTSSENGYGTCNNITPMHLAILARRQVMIRCLDKRDAGFGRVRKPDGKLATAPPRWLLVDRLPGLGLDGVEATIDTLLSLRWNIDAPLCDDEKRILDLAYAMKDDMSGRQAAIINHLRQRNARRKGELTLSRAPTMNAL
jgi:hypothetical protein